MNKKWTILLIEGILPVLVAGVWLMGMNGCDSIPEITESIVNSGESPDVEEPVELPPSIQEINAQPANYLNNEVVLEGLLYNENENYFTDPLDLVLEDSKGDKIRVIPWLPLEIPPGPNFEPPNPPVQSDFLDKQVQLIGQIQLIDNIVFLKVSHAKIIE